MGKPTPAMQQYLDIKQQYPDALLFFRLGDFYELFYEDAHIAHKELDITLTSKNKTSPQPIPMAGIPHHSVDKYLPRLLQAGYKIAIAEQIGEVQPGKLVERKVTQVLTPGTTIHEDVLFNNILALTYVDGIYVLAWGDVSLKTYTVTRVGHIEQVMKKLGTLNLRELVMSVETAGRDQIEQYAHDVLGIVVSFHDAPHDAVTYLQDILHVSSLRGYGQALTEGGVEAVSLLFAYISHMQQDSLYVHSINFSAADEGVYFDHIAVENLEIFQSRYEANKRHSLYHVMNTTATAAGSRELYTRLLTPTADSALLNQRFEAIRYMGDHRSLRDTLADFLQQLPDIAKIHARLLTRKANPQLLQSYMFALGILFDDPSFTMLKKELLNAGMEEKSITLLHQLYDLLQQAIPQEQLSLASKEPYILAGYDKDLDKYRQKAFHADDLLLQYQQEVQEHVGGLLVKLKFIKHQGYFFEVSKKEKEDFISAREDSNPKFAFTPGPTLKLAQRYTTSYLQNLYQEVHTAQDAYAAKEQEVFAKLLEKVSMASDAIAQYSQIVGTIDVAVHMSYLVETDRCLPHLHEKTHTHIVQGRHPVVEKYLAPHEHFIANDLKIGDTSNLHIITGPNMGGKSTYLRQNALIVLLAHCGLPIPAKKAQIAYVDGIYARIGAGDVLAKNQSTFMTEMLETSSILHNATQRSFVIIDELGRGTSTYDGVALAKSISVYLSQSIQTKTLLATHYHELTLLADTSPSIANYSVGVHETDEEVVFLKTIVTGRADKSYGIDVAKLAGMPHNVLKDACMYLQQLQQKDTSTTTQPMLDFSRPDTTIKQRLAQYDDLLTMLAAVDINTLSPVDALVYLQDIKKRFL